MELPTVNDTLKMAGMGAASPGDAVRTLIVRASEELVRSLPPSVRAILGTAQQVAGALTELQSGSATAWLAVVQAAQDEYVKRVVAGWDVLPKCREEMEAAAAALCPPAILCATGVRPGCGVWTPKPKRAGFVYWRPLPLAKAVETPAVKLPPKGAAGVERISWIPDVRKGPEDGYVFAPALFPYTAPGQYPTIPGLAATVHMQARFLDLVITPPEQQDWAALKALWYRTMAALARSRARLGNNYRPIALVKVIPASPSPSEVYLTPVGEIWAVSEATELVTEIEGGPAGTLKATVGQARAMLRALATIRLTEAAEVKALPKVSPKAKTYSPPGGPSAVVSRGGKKVPAVVAAAAAAYLLLR